MQNSKIDPVKVIIRKNDQLLFSYIAVDRFLKRTLSLEWFEHAVSLDRFYIGGIELLTLLLVKLLMNIQIITVPEKNLGQNKRGIWISHRGNFA